jgi:predicted phosphodiesterase
MTTHTVAVISDIHFDEHHEGAWEAFRKWHAEKKPTLTVALGDIVDLGMLSTYENEEYHSNYAIEQIQMAVRELNSLNREAGRLYYVPGNHGDRWERTVLGNNRKELRGAIGLTLREQMYAQGLDGSIRWIEEDRFTPGLYVGKRAALLRHGHRQGPRFGVVNQAAKQLREVPTVTTVVGHHHRAQLQCLTSLGNTVFGIANPHMSKVQEFAPDPNWQLGFTVLEFYGRSRLRDCEKFTPHLVVMDNEGHFAWNGKVY